MIFKTCGKQSVPTFSNETSLYMTFKTCGKQCVPTFSNGYISDCVAFSQSDRQYTEQGGIQTGLRVALPHVGHHTG